MGVVILNLGLSALQGALWFMNTKHGDYKKTSGHAFACGFCLGTAFVFFMYTAI